MIAPGSMVVLKGHHLFPMVVTDVGDIHADLRPDAAPEGPYIVARVHWLDANGVPHSETYPALILEEVDG